MRKQDKKIGRNTLEKLMPKIVLGEKGGVGKTAALALQLADWFDKGENPTKRQRSAKGKMGTK